VEENNAFTSLPLEDQKYFCDISRNTTYSFEEDFVFSFASPEEQLPTNRPSNGDLKFSKLLVL